MTLHQELNKPGGINLNNAINQDQRNKQLMFQIFAQDFMNSNKSIISDLFYGVNYNITQCGFCNTQSFNYQTYFFLIFPLEEVRIFKSQNNFNYNYNCFANNEVNIYDCFFYDQKINYMTGSNIMYCNFCRQTCNTSMRTILSTGPEILIIILNRGQGIQFNVKINFLEEINLENFIEMKQTGCIYKLIGVITHIGESGMGGHFIAYSKNPISNEWNKYNDSIVSPVSNFKKDVIDFAMPYLLFYQKST
jgi:ubiquitin C-terminal hydrolase